MGSSFNILKTRIMKHNNIIGIYVVVGIMLYGRTRIIALVDNEKDLVFKINEARKCYDYLFVAYYNVGIFGKTYVNPEEFNDFVFYYRIAEKHDLEIEYLQSILDGLAPVAAASEWDL